MPFLKKIRRQAGLAKLRRKTLTLKRSTSFCNFNRARQVGILFSTIDHGDYEYIKDFIAFLHGKNIQVSTIVFINSKKAPDFYHLNNSLHVISKHDLNWKFVPEGHHVTEFINKPFDILIDLTTEKLFPTYYISKLSRAGYKIGRLIDDKHCYDLMIDTSLDNTVPYLIQQIKHYLTVLFK